MVLIMMMMSTFALTGSARIGGMCSSAIHIEICKERGSVAAKVIHEHNGHKIDSETLVYTQIRKSVKDLIAGNFIACIFEIIF